MESELFNIIPNAIIENIIAAYNPYVLLIEPIETLNQKDWKARCKIVHELDVSEYDELPNDKWLFIYYNLCRKFKLNITGTIGEFWSCGYNYHGQLGQGDNENIYKFEEIKGIPNDIVSIACGVNHTIIQRANGTLLSSGNNYYGQLGHGDNKNRNKFEEIKGLPNDIVNIACGAYHTIIQRANGTLLSCGYNYSGQLGQGDNKNRNKFEEIKGLPNDIVSIACGFNHTIIYINSF